MARRSKTPPTTRRITFHIDAETTTGYVDIGQCLSLLNRRAYRQGMEYYVESWTLSANVASEAVISFISQTWVNCNAWVKAFHTWMASQEQVDNFDEIKGRYHDFKVFFEEGHATLGMLNNLKPHGFNPAFPLPSPTATVNWDASEIQIPNVGGSGNTVGYQLHMIGPDGNSKGIVEGYANSRARPQTTDPNTLTGTVSWMEAAFDTGENLGEIVTDLTYENDSPPYIIDQDTAYEFYPGGSNAFLGAGFGYDVSAPLAVNPSTGSFATRHGAGFIAPCGLLLISNEGASDFILTLNIAPGSSKGVLARSMQDVN